MGSKIFKFRGLGGIHENHENLPYSKGIITVCYIAAAARDQISGATTYTPGLLNDGYGTSYRHNESVVLSKSGKFTDNY